MKKLVVVFGAGASADFGVPTLGQLFKDTQAKYYLRKTPFLLNHLEEIFWKPRGHVLETSDESLTVEDMLTVLRDWELEKSVPPRLTTDELAKFRKSMYVLIYNALFEGKSTQQEHLNLLIDFARRQFDQTTWASFNWDCIFESSFWYSSGPRGRGTRTNPRLVVKLEDWYNGDSKHIYLKLHGSINWWTTADKLYYLRFGSGGSLQTYWADYAVKSTPAMHPVILEPSYYKYEDTVYNLLQPQWDVFLKNMVEADYVLVIGYSLPTADSQARCKMLTAFQANPNSLWGVIDPSQDTLNRYKKLFGKSRLQVFTGGLVGFNNSFAENFQALFPTFQPKEELKKT